MQLTLGGLFLCLAILYLPSGTAAWRHFWKGRRHNGNLGDPSPITHNISVADPPLPPDEWFIQTLDHFNATNDQTWKQVN